MALSTTNFYPVSISPQIPKFYITNNVFFLVHTSRLNRRIDSYAEWLERRAQGRSFGGLDNEWRHIGKMCLKNSPEKGCEHAVSAKTPKSINRNISGTINPTNKRYEDGVQTRRGISWMVGHYPKSNTTPLTAAILKIDMTSYYQNGWSDLDKIWQPDAE